MIYLKEFETETAYNAAKDGLLTPNVSLITENGEIKYLKEAPTPTHEYVDLGLPSGTLWAKCNIGAETETDFGNFYQYGKGADEYSVTSGDSNYTGVENPLAASADTAIQVWGGDWHTPTKTQFEELTANTTYEWTAINGVNGAKFTAQNSNYVFFPAAGLWEGETLCDNECDYWSSTPIDEYEVRRLLITENYKTVGNSERSYGCSVRPVKDAE